LILLLGSIPGWIVAIHYQLELHRMLGDQIRSWDGPAPDYVVGAGWAAFFLTAVGIFLVVVDVVQRFRKRSHD
jgi:hypothetical protein